MRAMVRVVEGVARAGGGSCRGAEFVAGAGGGSCRGAEDVARRTWQVRAAVRVVVRTTWHVPEWVRLGARATWRSQVPGGRCDAQTHALDRCQALRQEQGSRTDSVAPPAGPLAPRFLKGQYRRLRREPDPPRH